MSAGEAFPNLVGTVNTGSMADVSGLVTSDWYTPSTVCTTSPSETNNDSRVLDSYAAIANDWQYAYNEPYMTPFPTTTVESQQWPHYARSSIPDISVQQYTMHPPSYQLPQTLYSTKDLSRPRSSPSTFGPGAEHLSWPPAGGLGIYSSVAGHPTPPVTSTFPPGVFQTYGEEQYANSNTPEIRQPIPKRPFPTLAPNPEQVAAQKRKRDEDEQQQEGTLSSSKKRKRTSSVASADLSEDDRFLVQLKEDESLPWKDIANRFQTDKGKNFQVAALQMRYKRLREKFRIWQDEDVKALKQAHEYWEKYKWEIIAQRVSHTSLVHQNQVLTTT